MEEYYIRDINLDELEQNADKFKEQDPFNKSWEELKNLSGIEKNFKRRTDRLEKANNGPLVETTLQYNNVDVNNPGYQDSALAIRSGKDGAYSKEINPGKVYRNGYGLFDVITPPWNLYELANYYDTSFANHAAIDAKVENIVGLGYELQATQRVLMALEASDNASAIDKARKRVERAKVEVKEWFESLNSEESMTSTLMKVWTDYESTGNGYLEIGRTVTGEIGYVGHIPATTMRVRRLS